MMKEKEQPVFRPREVIGMSEDGSSLIFADNLEEARKRILNSKRVEAGLEESYPSPSSREKKEKPSRVRRTKYG